MNTSGLPPLSRSEQRKPRLSLSSVFSNRERDDLSRSNSPAQHSHEDSRLNHLLQENETLKAEVAQLRQSFVQNLRHHKPVMGSQFRLSSRNAGFQNATVLKVVKAQPKQQSPKCAHCPQLRHDLDLLQRRVQNQEEERETEQAKWTLERSQWQEIEHQRFVLASQDWQLKYDQLREPQTIDWSELQDQVKDLQSMRHRLKREHVQDLAKRQEIWTTTMSKIVQASEKHEIEAQKLLQAKIQEFVKRQTRDQEQAQMNWTKEIEKYQSACETKAQEQAKAWQKDREAWQQNELEAKEKIAELQGQMASLDQEHREGQEKIQLGTQEKIRELKEQIMRSDEQYHNAKEKIEALKEHIIRSNQQYHNAQTKVEALKEQSLRSDQQYQEAQEKIKSLKEQSLISDGQYQEAQETIKALEQQSLRSDELYQEARQQKAEEKQRLNDEIQTVQRQAETTEWRHRQELEQAMQSIVRLCVVAPSVNVNVPDAQLHTKTDMPQHQITRVIRENILPEFTKIFVQSSEGAGPTHASESLEVWLESLLSDMQHTIENHLMQVFHIQT